MKIQTTKNIWFTSDTHFGHKNICRGVSDWNWKDNPESVRPFDTLDQMNNAIVNNINNKVAQDDTLIHLGDWSFGGFENIKKFRDRLICENIIIILGNHDHHIKRNKENIRDLFSHVLKEEQLIINKQVFHVYHYAVESWFEQNRGTIMLHGHVHALREKRFGIGKRMDVGIDGSPDFAPYHIDEIIKLMENRPSTYHHGDRMLKS
jgi:calcineurin-like phosphoesterase family protein